MSDAPSSQSTFPLCALCGAQTRSLYALPGDRNVWLCAKCFFGEPPTRSYRYSYNRCRCATLSL